MRLFVSDTQHLVPSVFTQSLFTSFQGEGKETKKEE